MLIELLLTVGIAFFLIRMIIAFAPKLNLIDVPNARSVHTRNTPRGAGIGIILSLILICCTFESSLLLSHPLTFAGLILVFGIGILDDLKDAGPNVKFLVIFVASALSFYDGIGIHSLGHYFGTELPLGWFALPFTLFAVSGFTNAYNLVDGLDGLAGIIGLIILAVLLSIGYTHQDVFIVSIASVLGAALTSFLLLNWNPAQIFLGDSGSLTIGFIISILAIKSLDYIQPAVILFIAAIPVLDTLIVMIRRKRRGHSAFKADKTHLHHILLTFFDGNVKRTVITLALMQIIYSLTGLLFMTEIESTLVLILFFANLIVFYIFASSMLDNQERIHQLEKKLKKRKKKQDMQRNGDCMDSLDSAGI